MKARPDKIAKRYGSVLFDLASENNAIKAVLKDLNKLQQCIKAEPLEWLRVVSPSLPLYTQKRIIESLLSSLKIGSLVSRFLSVLCDHRRLHHLNLILKEFFERSKRAEGIVEGVLETTVKLSRKEIEMLQNSLKSQLGKNIKLDQEIKESLLGGVVLTIGSLMIDASIRTQLNRLGTVMKG